MDHYEIEPIVNFVEKVNVEKACKLCCLSSKELKSCFWNNEEIDMSSRSKYDWNVYSMNLKKYCKLVINSKGLVAQTYKYGKYLYDGRLYSNSFGLQKLQKNIRNYLCCDNYVELDIKNCHPCLLFYLADKNDLECDTLKDYVLNRDKILEKHQLSKLDILKAINTDKNTKKRNCDWYNLFIKDIENLKNELKISIDLPHVVNDKNPLSASINKIILSIEGEIIQKIIKKIGRENIGFPLFDALYLNRSYEVDIEEINNILCEYKYVKVALKETEVDISLPDNIENDNMEYSKVKEKFEEQHFQTLSPPTFWKQIVNTDGSNKYIQYNTADFKLACKEYNYIHIDDEGKMRKKDIFEAWIADTERRKYQTTDFLPYGLLDNCPEFVFNTFEGFEITKNTTSILDDDISITNILEYISNLVGEYNIYMNTKDITECPKTEYLLKYIAHLLQKPMEKTRKIIVLKGWTGTGKDTLLKLIRALVGFKYVDLTSDPFDLFKDFNDILDSKLAIFLNEMEGSDGIKIQEKLKDLATRDYNRVNAKHEKKIQQKNCIRLFVLSNNDSPVNVQTHDRRYVIFNSGFDLVANSKDEKQRDYAIKFWTKLNDDLNNISWLKKVYSQLLELDLTEWCPDKSAPITDEYKLLKEKSICPLYNYILDIVENNKYHDFYQSGESYYISFKTFKAKYDDYLEDNNLTPDYKIKEGWVKSKLAGCNNTFNPSVRKQFKINGLVSRKDFSEFKFKEMAEFIKQYIIQDSGESDEIIECQTFQLEEIYDSD